MNDDEGALFQKTVQIIVLDFGHADAMGQLHLLRGNIDAADIFVTGLTQKVQVRAVPAAKIDDPRTAVLRYVLLD